MVAGGYATTKNIWLKQQKKKKGFVRNSFGGPKTLIEICWTVELYNKFVGT